MSIEVHDMNMYENVYICRKYYLSGDVKHFIVLTELYLTYLVLN